MSFLLFVPKFFNRSTDKKVGKNILLKRNKSLFKNGFEEIPFVYIRLDESGNRREGLI